MLPHPAETNNHDPTIANDYGFVVDLITKYYNAPLDESNIDFREPRIMRQLAHDITSALLHNDQLDFTDQILRMHSINENTILDLKRPQLNLRKPN